jgi:hypothetical protein
MAAACCCDGECDGCPGCSAGTAPEQLQLVLAGGAPNLSISYDCSVCDTFPCDADDGTYILSGYGTGCSSASVGLYDEDCEPSCPGAEDACSWASASIDPAVMCDTTTGIIIVQVFECSGEWWIVVFKDAGPGANGWWQWERSLGMSAPDCSTIFPITLGSADYSFYQPTCPFYDIHHCCTYEDATVTISVV